MERQATDGSAQRALRELIDMMVSEHLPLHEATGYFRKAYVQTALAVSEGNQTRAARLIGLHRNTLAHILSEE